MHTSETRIPIALFALAMATSMMLGCAVLPREQATPTTPTAQAREETPTRQPTVGAVSGGMPQVVMITPPTGQPQSTALAFPALPVPFGAPTATPVSLVTLPTSQPTAPAVVFATLPAGNTPARPPATSPTPTEPPPPPTELLCCGASAGGTYVWSIRYPVGWQVTYIPDNPRDFLGVVVSNPQGTMRIGLIPSAMTPPGTALDTGDVDAFLDAYRAQREQENPGFKEFLRQPVAGVPEGRVWAGTWGSGQAQMWASYLAILYPIQPWTPGLPRGYLTMLGLEASSPEWSRGVATYEAMLKTLQMRKVSDGTTISPGVELGGPAVKPFLVRWCPNAETCCTWRAVTADRPGWACPVCGTETELWETPCR